MRKERKTMSTVARSCRHWRASSRQIDAQGSNWIISWVTSLSLRPVLLFCLSSTHVSGHISSTVNRRSAENSDATRMTCLQRVKNSVQKNGFICYRDQLAQQEHKRFFQMVLSLLYAAIHSNRQPQSKHYLFRRFIQRIIQLLRL